MSKLSFNAELASSNRVLKVGLEIYKFKEDGMYIIYCPSLDLSAYAKTEKEVEAEFSEVFKVHITYCLNKKTLAEDLRNHGWRFKSLNQKKIKAPALEEMLSKNETLKDIISKKNYVKTSTRVEIPQMA